MEIVAAEFTQKTRKKYLITYDYNFIKLTLFFSSF